MNLTIANANTYEYCGAELECKITSSIVDGEDNTEYTTYGVRVTNTFGDTIYNRDDISTDKAFVERFITLCETHFVSSIHIDEILDDYLF